MVHTIELTGEAAHAFSRPRGWPFSINPFGYVKGLFGTQQQFRGMLRYHGGNSISSLGGAQYYTTYQMTILRAGEFERAVLYGGGLYGLYKGGEWVFYE